MLIGCAALLQLIGELDLLRALASPRIIRMPMLDWLPALTPVTTAVLAVAWGVSAGAFAIGWRTRLAGALLTAVFAVHILIDQQAYSNHAYLFVLVCPLLTLADAGAAWSVDARRAWPGTRPSVPGWPVFLLMVQTSLVYLFAALSKINPGYLSGRALAPFVPYQSGVELFGAYATALLVLLASWIAIPLEALLAYWLWLPRRRTAAAVLGVAMHIGMVIIMYRTRLDLTVFALQMWALYLLFLGPIVVAAAERSVSRARRTSRRSYARTEH